MYFLVGSPPQRMPNRSKREEMRRRKDEEKGREKDHVRQFSHAFCEERQTYGGNIPMSN